MSSGRRGGWVTPIFLTPPFSKRLPFRVNRGWGRISANVSPKRPEKACHGHLGAVCTFVRFRAPRSAHWDGGSRVTVGAPVLENCDRDGYRQMGTTLTPDHQLTTEPLRHHGHAHGRRCWVATEKCGRSRILTLYISPRFQHDAMAESRPRACTFSGCLRHRTSVPT